MSEPNEGYRLRIVSLADGRPSVVDNQWLVSCDVDAREGRGMVIATDDPAKALLFPRPAAALMYWQRQSKHTPLRPDGKPNRPLTAYTVTIEPVT
jgi:hypothetical protein